MSIVQKLKLDTWISLVLIISSVILLNIASGFPETTALFPRITLYLIIILSLIVIVESIRKADKNETKEASSFKLKEVTKNSGLMYMMIIAYFFVLPTLGFILSTMLFLVAGFYYLGSKNLIKNLIIGMAFNLFVYVGFIKFLNVPIQILPFFMR